MFRTSLRPVVAVFVVLALVLAALFAITTRATPLWQSQARLPHGTVLLLQGTPYYWVADEAGVLHWASDTRALVGRYAKWEHVREVTTAELARLPRGEPWLTAPFAFVRDRDNQLYLVRWESGVKWPALSSVPSLEALQFFGITSGVVEQHVTDQRTWEWVAGVPLEEVKAEFTPIPPATERAPAQASVWHSGVWSGTGTQRSPESTYPVTIVLSKSVLDPHLGVVIGTVEYPSFPCGGKLGLISITADEVALAERLTSGLDNCTSQGRVTLTKRSEWRLFYVWSQPDEYMTVTGQLLRRDESA
jgi:hypothetical protein